MSTRGAKCDWLVGDAIDDEHPHLHECGQRAILEFVRTARVMGRETHTRYPRCHRHAPPRAIARAREEGYTVHIFDKEGG